MRPLHTMTVLAALLGACWGTLPAQAALVNLAPATVGQTGQTITFGGMADDGTVNPSFTLAPGFTVSFGSYFVGQGLTSSEADGGLFYLTRTQPAGKLALAEDPENYAVITTDASTADDSNERLAGAAPGQFLGPVAILFSIPVQQVAFTAGVFSEAGDLSVQAFGIDGTSLGVIGNTAPGDRRFVLADSNGTAIAGLSLYIPDQSLNGFSIDDVSVLAVLPPTGVPEPATLPLFAAFLLGGLGTTMLRRQHD